MAPERSSDLLFEEAATPWAWIAFALIAIACGVFAIVALPPTTAKGVLAAAVFGLFAVLMAALAVFAFKKRNDATRYFSDRAETYRGGALLHRLKYEDVQRVAYGFVPDGSREFLAFSGDGGAARFHITVFGDEKEAAAGSYATATPQKLRALRDHLYDCVVRSLREAVQSRGRAPWFRDVEIAPDGLYLGGTRALWSQVNIVADEKTGDVHVSAVGKSQKTSMIEDNVVAGLMLVEELQHAKSRPPTRAR